MNKRGGNVVYYMGFIFIKIREKKDGNTLYRCGVRVCSGSLVVSPENKILNMTQHVHADEFKEIEKRKLFASIFLESQTIRNNAKEIVFDKTKNVDFRVLSKLPKIKSPRDKIKKQRNFIGSFVLRCESKIPDTIKYDGGGGLFFTKAQRRILQEL